ncbi:catalase [Xylariales sp. AK1849]|nr:catalase [Xylariales sp. AK1849]
MAMDDWQEAAFSSRHIHNRIGRNGAQAGSKRHNGYFDVRKSFGSYTFKCAAWQKLKSSTAELKRHAGPEIELFRLTDDGNSIVGQLVLPGLLDATVILAGSKMVLQNTILSLESEAAEMKETPDPDSGQVDKSRNSASGDESSSEVEMEYDLEERRFKTFEKNSFRSPKFWFQWRGSVIGPESALRVDSSKTQTGLGYVVFSGNDCHKFRGTINCDILDWKDVSISGWKTVSRTERDVAVSWK